MATDKRLDQVKLVNSAESVLVVNGDQVEKATLAGFANSMGSSVPLQQTSEQVSITGLYARTSDGKMVELTKESVAQVMAELLGKGNLSVSDLNDLKMVGCWSIAGVTIDNCPIDYGTVSVTKTNGYYEWLQILHSRSNEVFFRIGNYIEWQNWQRIDNFGYNTLAELSSGVAARMSIDLTNGTDLNNIKTNGSYFIRVGTNAPGEYFHFNVLQNKNTGDLVQYGFVMSATINMHIRNFFNGAWTQWKSVNINA